MMIEGFPEAGPSVDYPQIKGDLYLDSAGAGLPPKSVVDRFAREVTSQLYANPHSGTSNGSNKRIERVRSRILSLCNVDSSMYSVVFVANATAAMKLVAESTDWRGRKFWYLTDSHTSVLGMREYALRRDIHSRGSRELSSQPDDFGMRVKSLGIDEVEHYLDENECISKNSAIPHTTSLLQAPSVVDAFRHDSGSELDEDFGLFAYTAQSNFNGFEYPLSWSNRFASLQDKNGKRRWNVLLDASSYGFIDLSAHPADALILSFYKMIGFPTGVAALILRNDFAETLRKPYFGGGTVDAVDPHSAWYKPRTKIPARFEDGTLPFLDIIAVDHGLDWLDEKGGWKSMKIKAKELAGEARKMMMELRYSSVSDNRARPLCHIYQGGVRSDSGKTNDASMDANHGPIIAFNLLQQDGHPLAGSEVSRLAQLQGIHLRSGCFCNLGACSYHLRLERDSIRSNAESGERVCGDNVDILGGRHVTALRISFGPMNDLNDVHQWIKFLDYYFAKTAEPLSSVAAIVDGDEVLVAELSQINVYPIKSCGGFAVDRWPMTAAGLLYDRVFMLVDEMNTPITQKTYTQMADIQVLELDFQTEELVLSAPSMEMLVLSLKNQNGSMSVTTQVCRRSSIKSVSHTADAASAWFTKFMGFPCHLTRISDTDASYKTDLSSQQRRVSAQERSIAFQNESQLLLISMPSYRALEDRATSGRGLKEREMTVEGFRANLLIERPKLADGRGLHLEPFAEEGWTDLTIRIGDQIFKADGPCKRCGVIGRSAFASLSKLRRKKGFVYFGQHITHVQNCNSMYPFLQKGAPVMITRKSFV
ncbi:pyridoxal phosphate-dependent transferase [Chytridium lagenaria]|nr:pyridoxal phosphate-dependent transferase [Chytridium lagenaria]